MFQLISCSAVFPGSMMVELEDRVGQLESWAEGKGVVVMGAAGTFCSGSDLNVVKAISSPQVEQQRQKAVSLGVFFFFF